MNTKELIQSKKTDFDKAIEFYKTDIQSIRTGRATPALVEDLPVEYYGSVMHVKELATIAAPEPRTLQIQPWDKGAVEPISSAIRKSSIGLAPVVDGSIIRLNIPALTEERRKEFIKVLKQKSEEVRIRIRKVREEVINKIKSLEKDGEISEDEAFDGRESVQKIVDEHNQQIETLEKKKEQELLN